MKIAIHNKKGFLMQSNNQRKSSYPISPIFLNRWSPRAMSDAPITNEELMPLFEAARWAPSSYNEQPWRFMYSHKGSATWDTLFALINPFNQTWAKNAGVLVLVLSKNFFENTGLPSNAHTFDAGAAWMSLALQGSINGLAIRAIAGFDYDQARTVLHIPAEFKIEVMIAIGKPGEKEELPIQFQAKETPSDRKPLQEIVFKDVFK
jgi:nitroreductase